MSPQGQSPDPGATTSQLKQAKPRKAAVSAEQNVAGRAGSAGGVVLEKERTAKGLASAQSSKSAAKAVVAMSSEAKDKEATTTPDAATSTGPNRQRRRPRKLNRDAPADNASFVSIPTSGTPAPAPTTELEALKSRVRGLEAKVEELYHASEGRNRSPRRRGKSRKNSSAQSVPQAKMLPPRLRTKKLMRSLCVLKRSWRAQGEIWRYTNLEASLGGKRQRRKIQETLKRSREAKAKRS
jgi:hypothetical protein